MPYLIGMDEAGYGPNLGPLVISATVWHLPHGSSHVDLYDRLADVVTPSAAQSDHRIPIADSKILYKQGKGLRALERGLMPALAVCQRPVTNWTNLWHALNADPTGYRVGLPWYAEYQVPLPTATDADELLDLKRTLERGLQASGVRLEAIESRAILPEQFNELTEQHGSKGTALSHSTLKLLTDVLVRLQAEPRIIVCDKHGGRNRYGQLLQQHFPDPLIEVHAECRTESIYRWGAAPERCEVQFRKGGEAFLPAALASMASKYLREMCMRAENDFWCQHVPGLHRTAGYPVDAKRFKTEIAACQQRLGVDDRILWRNR